VAESAYAEGDFSNARIAFRAALALAETRGDSVGEARILTWLGLAARNLGEYAESRALGERALALKLSLGLRAELFRSYNALGLLAWNEGRHDEALVRFAAASEAAIAVGDRSGLAKLANNVALVQAELGNFSEARQGFLEAGRAARELQDSSSEGRSLSNLGMLEIQLGNPHAGIASLQAARLLLAAVGDVTGEQNALGQLGSAYDALGEPRLAFAALDSALRLSRDQGLRQEEASNLELIAGLHRQAGDLQRALQLYDQAHAINGELGNAVEQGTNRRNTAEIQMALGRRDVARTHTLEALRLHRGSDAPLQELRDLLVLAEIALAADSPLVSDEHFRSAQRLSAKLDTRIARVEVALAGAALALGKGNPRGALRMLSTSRQDLALGGYGGEWQAASLRARAFSRLSLLDSAAAAGRQAVAAVDRMRGSFGSGFLRNAFAADKASAYGELVEVLLRLGRTEEAFEVSDGARNHALVEHLAGAGDDASLARATVRSVGEAAGMLRRIDSLVVRLDAIDETPRAVRDSGSRAQAAALARHLAEARGAYEALLVRVAEQDAPGSAMLGWGSTRVKDVQQVLGPDEALLEYLVTPARLVIFVVTRSGVRSLGTEISLEDLARRVRLARDLVGMPGGDVHQPDQVLRGLHALLIAPAERAGLFGGMRRLVVVAHSVLSYLPFAALQREGTGSYLMEDYALLQLPSAASLAVLRGATRAEEIGSGRGATVFAPFPKTLPGTSREARAVRRAVGSARAERGRNATELRVRRALSGGGTVHIASHGVMNSRNPMFSRIELAAGDGGADDDGRLEVHELLALRIQSPLVFLSGCETGVGAAWSTQFGRGEDYATLAQAFLYAGAGSVIATLWRIGDEGAAAFAERFYARAGTLSPAQALAEAQREMAKDARFGSPYYWAAYQVFGAGGSGPGPHRSAQLPVERR
jgi:CHAT domain-containing protein